MKNRVGILVCTVLLLLSGCSEPAATATPTATSDPAVVDVITSAEELAGVWHRTTRSSFGGEVYRQYTGEGTYRMGSSPKELKDQPRVEGRFWFEGDQIVVQDTSGLPGYDICVEGEKAGKYKVELLVDGHIRFVLIEDECTERGQMLGSGEMEQVP